MLKFSHENVTSPFRASAGMQTPLPCDGWESHTAQPGQGDTSSTTDAAVQVVHSHFWSSQGPLADPGSQHTVAGPAASLTTTRGQGKGRRDLWGSGNVQLLIDSHTKQTKHYTVL